MVSLAENAFLAWFYKNPDWVLFTLLANTAMLMVLLLGWPDAAPVPASTQSRTTHWAFLPWLGLLPALVALAILLNQTVAASNENLSKQLAYRQILADIGRLQSEGQIAPDAIIISPSHGIPWEWSNPLILDFPQIPFLDTGWITFSPFYEGALQHYDLEPLPQAIVGKSNVYLMTKLIFQPFLAQYYQEHEHMAVTFEPIYNIPAAYHAVEYTDTQLYRVVRAR